MAEQKAAEPEKKGYFARRREKKEAAEPLPSKPADAPARPLATSRPGPPGKPSPAVARPEARYSLESIPEVEKRIDRMAATERRQRLLERYEAKFGEKLDVPNVFVSIEDEKKAGAASAADGMAGGAKEIPEDRLAAVTGMAPPPKASAPKPAAPPPARPGLFGGKPVTAAPAKPVAPVTGKPAAAAFAKAGAPIAPAPKPMEPKKPSPVNGSSFWKYLWPYWRLPMRGYAKYYWPEKPGIQAGFTIIDIPIWIILAIPRIGLCPVGYFLERKKRKAAAVAELDAAAAAN